MLAELMQDIPLLERFQVLAAATVKMTAFWHVAPCCLEKFSDVLEVLATSIIRSYFC
jgi:hypothetical protein